MDPEIRDRRSKSRVIISEAIMVLAVILTVVVLALVVSGYWLGSGLKVERQGMLQISSTPSGAYVELDGVTSSWLERTNTSKVLAAGEHDIALIKDGYDTWSRTVNIREGLLYRIHYPRLFLTEREKTAVYDTSKYTFATISPDGNKMLLSGNTTKWLLLNLESENLDPKTLDVSAIFNAVSLADGAETGLFTGTITSANWSRDDSRVLLSVSANFATEWVVLNLKDLKNSVNLTRDFAVDFSSVTLLDGSANTLLAVRDHNLHKIDVSARSISAVLVEDVVSFDHFDNEIVFVAARADGTFYVGLTKVGDGKIVELADFSTPPKVVISRFYDDKYLTILNENFVTLYKKDDFSEVLSFELSFLPSGLKVGHDGEFIEMTAGANFATLDMEARAVREWTIDAGSFGWLDSDMLFSVSDGELFVYDFDGLNRRALSKNVSAHFPVTITSDKWLYYVSDYQLVREVVAN